MTYFREAQPAKPSVLLTDAPTVPPPPQAQLLQSAQPWILPVSQELESHFSSTLGVVEPQQEGGVDKPKG